MGRTAPLIKWQCDGCTLEESVPVNRPAAGWRTLRVSRPTPDVTEPQNAILSTLNQMAAPVESSINLCGPCLTRVNTFIHEELQKQVET